MFFVCRKELFFRNGRLKNGILCARSKTAKLTKTALQFFQIYPCFGTSKQLQTTLISNLLGAENEFGKRLDEIRAEKAVYVVERTTLYPSLGTSVGKSSCKTTL